MYTLNTLTQQEHIVLALVAKGWRNAQIAKELFISPRTVENHLYHIFDKLGVESRTEAALYALHMGWLVLPEISRNPEDAGSNQEYARKIS